MPSNKTNSTKKPATGERQSRGDSVNQVIAELVRYHLVLAEPDDRADANVAKLVSELQSMATRPLWTDASWVFCDRCGCSVVSDLIHPDGHHYADDGSFLCADCWEHE